MTFIKQTVSGEGIGNCLGACISSLTGIDLSEFPIHHDGSIDGDWAKRINKILKPYGYQMIAFDFTKETLEIIDTPIIAGGDSPNYEGQKHVVLWRNGKMLFDPAPSNKGLKGDPKYYILILPYWGGLINITGGD